MTLQANASTISGTAAQLAKLYFSRFIGWSAFGIGLNFFALIVLLIATRGKLFLLSLICVVVGSALWLALAHKQALQSCLHAVCQQHLATVLPYLIGKLPLDKISNQQVAGISDKLQAQQQNLQQVSATLQQIQLPSLLQKIVARLGQNKLAAIILQAHKEVDFQQGSTPANVEKLSAIATQHIPADALAPSWEMPRNLLVGNIGVVVFLMILA